MTNQNLSSKEGVKQDGRVPSEKESKEWVSSESFTGAKEATPKEVK